MNHRRGAIEKRKKENCWSKKGQKRERNKLKDKDSAVKYLMAIR